MMYERHIIGIALIVFGIYMIHRGFTEDLAKGDGLDSPAFLRPMMIGIGFLSVLGGAMYFWFIVGHLEMGP